MERQKRKLKGIADLYNIEDERQKRQPSQAEDISGRNISEQVTSEQTTIKASTTTSDVVPEVISEENTLKTKDTSPFTQARDSQSPVENSIPNIPQKNISQQNIPESNVVRQDIPQRGISQSDISQEDISSTTTWSSSLVDAGRGYFPIYNDVTDRLIRELMLDVYEQSVLLKMYRESRGWKSDECEISHAEIVRSCNISKSQSQRTLAKLSSKGLIINLGRSKSGPERNRFRVLPGVPIVPPKNISRENISHQDEDVSPRNMVPGQDISPVNTNKNNNKESLNTHTQQGVGVGSRFTLEECRRFAEHLQKTGQGINNPGGYATTIFRSGEFDAHIEAFLEPGAVPFESGSCPDCGGSGYYYPEGVEKGVKICKHEKLKGVGQK